MPLNNESRRSRRMLREQPISRIFPNLITVAGLCCGLTAIRFAMAERWELSVSFIIAAALIDGMDGRIARLLGATSVFGAQLDSLSDFLCFGVAPALVLYMWQLDEVRGLGWAVTLFFAVCCALRLARFNTALSTEEPQPWQKKFFTGIPSPAGGILALLPLILYLHSGEEAILPPLAIALHAVLIAILMASRIPTFSAKQTRVSHDYILPLMLAGAFIVALFIIEPWWSITLLSLCYLLSIPVSMRSYARLKAQARANMRVKEGNVAARE